MHLLPSCYIRFGGGCMRWWLSLLCCLLLLLPVASSAQAAPLPEVVEQPSLDLTPTEQEIVNLVNQERAKAGLHPLTVSAELTLSARRYSAYMAQANFFGHVGPDGSTLVTRDTAAGYTGWTYLAENLAAGQPTPRAAVDGWLASPSHRANIFSPYVYETGVGYAAGGTYGHYWTQEFGARSGGYSAPSSAPRASAPSSRSEPRSVPSVASWTCPQTGYTVSGGWLSFVQTHGGVDNFGFPRSVVVTDPTAGGQTVQFFQRLILEWHPENPPEHRLQRRLLGDIIYPGVDAPLPESSAPPGPYHYFPFSPDSPTGLGHFVANYTRTGEAIYFKDYFDSHGGVEAFGYPKEEPKWRNGRWTQRFQAAVFEYHPENDIPGNVPGTDIPYRNYRVQLELLGDKYIELNGLIFK